MTNVLEIARGYVAAGLSVLPIRADGTKAPAVASWSPYTDAIATDAELREMFAGNVGIGIITGRVSGNLEVIDFDDPAKLKPWRDRCRSQGMAEVTSRLVLIETPTGGFHVLYRSENAPDGNTKLAYAIGTDGRREIAIETRGERGYVLAPGSPPACHSSHKPYKLVHGAYEQLPVLTAEERVKLLDAARELDETPSPPPARQEHETPMGATGLTPGDDYDARGDIRPLLERHGWTPVSIDASGEKWRRPGKSEGISATLAHCTSNGVPLFHAFSSNAQPFEADNDYGPFRVYALLEHGGDPSAAAKQLYAEGYGDRRTDERRRPAEPGNTSEAFKPQKKSYPDPPDDDAFYGTLGEIVKAIEDHTEADPVGILAQALVMFGSVIGRTAHWTAERDTHYGNLFAVTVGPTSSGGKGVAYGHARSIFDEVDPEWARNRIKGGSSTGEGLIHHVRDATTKLVKGVEEIVDEGVTDKRLLVFESEYASALKRMNAPHNTLSAIFRQAWDGLGALSTLTKGAPETATGAHISLIAHITPDELRRYLTDTETANGYANRNLWLSVRRSKSLPDGSSLDPSVLSPYITRLKNAVGFARTAGEIQRDQSATLVWRAVYDRLRSEKPGLLGPITSRAAPQVMRVAMLYALIDLSPEIRAAHLIAALALWEYCENSARYLFGDTSGDPIADRILAELIRLRPAGLDRTAINRLFDGHVTANRIDSALKILAEGGLARCDRQSTGGRDAEVWTAV